MTQPHQDRLHAQGVVERRLRRVVLALSSFVLVAALSVSTSAAQATDPDPGNEPAEPDFALLKEALTIIEDRFVDGAAVSSEDLSSGSIRGMVEALGDDGHTVYLTPDELAAERDALEGRVSGIGVVMDQRAGAPLIISVIDGSPADLAGVRGGDVIVSVDGVDITRIPLDELAGLVRGEVDTVVRIAVERPGESEPIDLRIVRSNVQVDPTSWAFVPGSDIAVVRIVQFSAQSGRETQEAIEAVLEGGATGIVLDLRGNPGGLVDEALVVAGSFLSDSVAYQEQGRDGPLHAVRVKTGPTIAPEIPLVVLVDYGTASSAEILAAALRDNARAVIVGEQTFGTGTVLNTFELSDGSALRLGVLRWLTPDGEDVFRVGIAPDDKVGLPQGAVALVPGDLVGMTSADLARSSDLPLLRALERFGP
ncbi:MAG: S41 family peptidase [Chloroflexota bacterium]